MSRRVVGVQTTVNRRKGRHTCCYADGTVLHAGVLDALSVAPPPRRLRDVIVVVQPMAVVVTAGSTEIAVVVTDGVSQRCVIANITVIGSFSTYPFYNRPGIDTT